MAIPIEVEPPELFKEFGFYECCTFCEKPTDTWHKITNNPVCIECAKTHNVAEPHNYTKPAGPR